VIRQVHTDDYMGRRFDLKRCNCWHLVRDVWRDMCGVDLGDLTPGRPSVRELEGAVEHAAAGPSFQRLEKAQSPCIVLLRRGLDVPHVGVLLRGRLLHITADGVRHDPLDYVAQAFASCEFYVPRAA
jgi:hypothetical protein